MKKKIRVTINILPEIKEIIDKKAKESHVAAANICGKIVEKHFFENKEEAVLNDIVFYLERLLYFNHMNFDILKKTAGADVKKNHMAALEAIRVFKKTIAGFKERPD